MNNIQQKIAALSAMELPNTTVVGVLRGHGGLFKAGTDMPPLYRVMLEGSFGEGSYIRAEIWLPDDWNGIFVGLGNGGMAGALGYENLKLNVTNGNAAIHNDMGTSRGLESGIGNPEVWKDFGWRATHWATVTAKAIIEAHYGKKPKYSYFVAESTGGNQAFSEACRFPEDYDGIIAGVPANNRVPLHGFFHWGFKHLVRADKSVLFNRDEILKISDYAVDFFRLRGWGSDEYSFALYPYTDENTNEDFIKFLREKNEFTEEQLTALKALYDGPVNPRTGKRIYCGLPIGTEKYGGIPSGYGGFAPHHYPFIWALGDKFDPFAFDFDKDFDKVINTVGPDMDINDADLSAFRDHGGKLLTYSGLCDGLVPYPDAVKHVDRIYEATSDADSFLRYFIIPGKNHSAGSNGVNNLGGSLPNLANMLAILRDWRENGNAPEKLIGNNSVEGEVKGTIEIPKYIPGTVKYPPACDDEYLEI